ncbi:unnamed protein product, partial [Pelagomonas calceolata]
GQPRVQRLLGGGEPLLRARERPAVLAGDEPQERQREPRVEGVEARARLRRGAQHADPPPERLQRGGHVALSQPAPVGGVGEAPEDDRVDAAGQPAQLVHDVVERRRVARVHEEHRGGGAVVDVDRRRVDGPLGLRLVADVPDVDLAPLPTVARRPRDGGGPEFPRRLVRVAEAAAGQALEQRRLPRAPAAAQDDAQVVADALRAEPLAQPRVDARDAP